MAVGLSDRFLMALSMDGDNSVFSKVLTVLLSLIFFFLLSYVFQHGSADKEIIPQKQCGKEVRKIDTTKIALVLSTITVLLNIALFIYNKWR